MYTSPTPEHDKLKAIDDSGERDIVQSFLDWLDQHYIICDVPDHEDLYRTHKSLEKIMAEYFKINLETIETERRAMLFNLREAQAQQDKAKK